LSKIDNDSTAIHATISADILHIKKTSNKLNQKKEKEIINRMLRKKQGID
jgi:3-oxoacyl-(acyl-carrier-protein) synthase